MAKAEASRKATEKEEGGSWQLGVDAQDNPLMYNTKTGATKTTTILKPGTATNAGNSNVTGTDFLKTLPTQRAATVQAIGEGPDGTYPINASFEGRSIVGAASCHGLS